MMKPGEYYLYTNDKIVEVVRVLEDEDTVAIRFVGDAPSTTYVHPNHLRLPETILDGDGHLWDLQPSKVYRSRHTFDQKGLRGVVHQHGKATPNEKRFGVGDIVRIKPHEYRVARIDHPEEVVLTPVVEGQGDEWIISPGELELVRSAPKPMAAYAGVWRSRDPVKKADVVVNIDRSGELRGRFIADNGSLSHPAGMTPESLDRDWFKL